MQTSILLFGFAIGIQHAFEADHLAAISALVSRRTSVLEITRHGVAWGLGHTLALLAISSLVLLSPCSLPPGFTSALETLVGLLLVLLAARILVGLWRDRVHFHTHRHEGGEVHFHAHSHRGEHLESGEHENLREPENQTEPMRRAEHGPSVEPMKHAETVHEHEHAPWSWRALVVGLAHGAAGSAALTVYVAASLESPTAGLAYVVLFGLGSILGMTLLSLLIAVPLSATARRLTWANRGLQLLVGLASMAIGVRLLLQHGGRWLG